MKTTFKMIAGAVSLGAALTAGAFAQEPAGSISELLNRVRADTREASQENQQRLREFQQATSQQQTLLNQARAELRQLEQQAANLTAEFESNQTRIDELNAELREAQGAFNELFGEARRKAGEYGAVINSSLISAEYPGRADTLMNLSESSVLPTRGELDDIWESVIEEMIYQQQVSRFSTTISGVADGEPVDTVRVGPFIGFYNDGGVGYARWAETAGVWNLRNLDRQPPGGLLDSARSLFNAGPGEIAIGPVDPTRGNLLQVYKDVPNLQERIDQGGTIGRIILVVLAISAAFGLFRLFTLLMTSMAVGAQKRSSTPRKSNPLGRVMLAFENSKSKDVEGMELALDAAVMKETPKLDFGLNFMKLAAGIAPLLGLLGTVTGMIRVFTQITLFGTGDPQIMAGGISEALVTTVLGLISAIPLLFIHSFAQSFARGVQQTLEEQAAGMVARHAEESGQ